MTPSDKQIVRTVIKLFCLIMERSREEMEWSCIRAIEKTKSEKKVVVKIAKDSPYYVSFKGAMELTGLSRSSITRRVQEGVIKQYYLGKSIRFKISELNKITTKDDDTHVDNIQ